MADTTPRKPTEAARKAGAKRDGAKPILLAGGNPQIAKADGDAPVQAYIAAHAKLEERCRASPRRPHRAHCTRHARR